MKTFFLEKVFKSEWWLNCIIFRLEHIQTGPVHVVYFFAFKKNVCNLVTNGTRENYDMVSLLPILRFVLDEKFQRNASKFEVTLGFHIYKIWQILKRFAGTFRRAQTLKWGGVVLEF